MSEQKQAAHLNQLLATLLDAYDENGATGDRIDIKVLEILVGQGSVTTMALVVHELATNSLKYGALSSPSGTLQVSCEAEGNDLVMVWREKGGPPVKMERGEPGFGSKLVNRSITGQLGGSIEFEWPAEGLIATLRMSKARLGI